VQWEDVEAALGWAPLGEAEAEQVAVQIKYDGYIARQRAEVERLKGQGATALPQDLDYTTVAGLSHEVCQKLSDARPDSLERAARIPGVTPAAVAQLAIHLKKQSLRSTAC
jgi:tRNA uridine 5-carboxymethylaminomethyl modification enzyme